jgi:hypothetical protein
MSAACSKFNSSPRRMRATTLPSLSKRRIRLASWPASSTRVGEGRDAHPQLRCSVEKEIAERSGQATSSLERGCFADPLLWNVEVRFALSGDIVAETERKRAESLISPKPAKAKAKKATADSDNTAPSEIDPDTIAFNNTASNGDICSRCLEQLHLLLCDSRIDWEKVIETVGIEKIQEIIEELKSKLADHADTRSREREWREAEAANQLPTPPDAN